MGDAIYGVNDGLAAIFGMIAGVSGFTDNHRMILVSGLFGAIASTLSMGAGAWLAARSENEVKECELLHQRQQITQNLEDYKWTLHKEYIENGFSQDEARWIVDRLASNPERFQQMMLNEHLEVHDHHKKNPWHAMLFAGLSTLVGALIPLVPLFFLSHQAAFIAAAVVSITAHYVVGAVKSLVTMRPWWQSGFEMMAVGILVGIVSYGLGSLSSLMV
ncbi:VIT1/CCC1 transporter family protein [Sulfoacidibacillus thermotolerans]|uniref:VIT1/CCC1 transporter family protein n=1 Tax=Sulfoacidibacillus thermotolerans TaxID=1765684 RepID=UPI0015E8021E|nr:VIT1/CCC1 transporter family protein [Sulfoacidibacillus thermotolerans]